jgi:hypothetical protein
VSISPHDLPTYLVSQEIKEKNVREVTSRSGPEISVSCVPEVGLLCAAVRPPDNAVFSLPSNADSFDVPMNQTCIKDILLRARESRKRLLSGRVKSWKVAVLCRRERTSSGYPCFIFPLP